LSYLGVSGDHNKIPLFCKVFFGWNTNFAVDLMPDVIRDGWAGENGV